MPRPVTQLRRLSQAILSGTNARIRRTDWWTVLVEVGVVVLGILIAFELNEWDQRRQARNEEELVLRHLLEETTADLAAVSLIRDEHRQSAGNYRLLIAAIGNPDLIAAYRRRGELGCNLLRMPAVRYHSPRGLEAGERADLIEDSELRHLIRAADAERAFNDRQLDFFRDAFDRYSEIIEPHMQWKPTPQGTFECSVNLAGLLGDRRALNALPKAGRDQQRFADYRERELLSTKRLAARVLCLEQGTCDEG